MRMTPLALLFALAFLVSVDVRILGPVLPSISLSLGSSAGTVGLAMTTYTLAYGVGQLVYGPLSDRFGRIAVVRAAGLGFGACAALSALATTTPQFVVIRLLVGAFAGAVIPMALVFIGDTVPYARRQAVIGRFSMITSAALALSASIGGAVAHLVSWRAMLLGYGLLALIPVGLMWRLDSLPPPRGPDCATGSFADFLRDRRARAVYVAVFLEGFFLWGGVTYLGSFGTARHGLDQFAVGLLIALFGVGTMTGGALMGHIRRRASENALAAAGGILMAVAFLVLVPRWPTAVFAASMLVLGFGFVGLHTTLQLRGTEIGGAAARGKAFSLFAFSLFGGMSAGTATLGRLVDAGSYEAVFAVVGVGLAVVGLGTALAPSRPQSDGDRREATG
ncbi:MAG: MFS transporter [Zetaproteobacteria bacterium]|nr:MAG: MFS transporter [Zetaproteobacteria bacterium]